MFFFALVVEPGLDAGDANKKGDLNKTNLTGHVHIEHKQNNKHNNNKRRLHQVDPQTHVLSFVLYKYKTQ